MMVFDYYYDTSALLSDSCREKLSGKRIILASNRGPVEYHLSDGGNIVEQRGSGGVVTALSAIAQYADTTWVASAMTDGERRAAARARGDSLKVPLMGDRFQLRFVCPPKSAYYKFYSVFSNPILWFIQHYMWNLPYSPNIDAEAYDAWENGYVPVNQEFARAIVSEAIRRGPSPLIMIQDYHLYLAPAYIREMLPNIVMQHFTHIPWPDPGYWHILPAPMREEICRSLCSSDIVGFQTRRDVRNFLNTCDFFLDDADVDIHSHTVTRNGHTTRVVAYPISVDVANLRELVTSEWVRNYERELRPLCGAKTIVRVDRADPSKNILRGLEAFDILLERYPRLIGQVNMLAFLVPSRTDIKQYQRYMEDIAGLVRSINNKYGTEEWKPIRVFYENNYPQAIAGLRLYDVLLVNSLYDGMNLVAKEGPIVNERNGILILSDTVGAYEQLKDGAISISPVDIEGTVEALYKALMMPEGERKSRAIILRRTIEEEDITLWLTRQLNDLLAVEQERHEQAILRSFLRQLHR